MNKLTLPVATGVPFRTCITCFITIHLKVSTCFRIIEARPLREEDLTYTDTTTNRELLGMGRKERERERERERECV